MEKKKVLFFDDEKWFTDYHEKLMVNEQFEVTVVNTPSEFLCEIEGDDRFDLFILDIMVPLSIFKDEDFNRITRPQRQRFHDGLSVGIVFHEILRKKPKYVNTPVIFYTSRADPLIPNSRYLSKPSSTKSLIHLIKDCLNIKN